VGGGFFFFFWTAWSGISVFNTNKTHRPHGPQDHAEAWGKGEKKEGPRAEMFKGGFPSSEDGFLLPKIARGPQAKGKAAGWGRIPKNQTNNHNQPPNTTQKQNNTKTQTNSPIPNSQTVDRWIARNITGGVRVGGGWGGLCRVVSGGEGGSQGEGESVRTWGAETPGAVGGGMWGGGTGGKPPNRRRGRGGNKYPRQLVGGRRALDKGKATNQNGRHGRVARQVQERPAPGLGGGTWRALRSGLTLSLLFRAFTWDFGTKQKTVSSYFYAHTSAKVKGGGGGWMKRGGNLGGLPRTTGISKHIYPNQKTGGPKMAYRVSVGLFRNSPKPALVLDER